MNVSERVYLRQQLKYTSRAAASEHCLLNVLLLKENPPRSAQPSSKKEIVELFDWP